MRNTLLLLSFSLVTLAHGQGSFATVFVTPPTNGCNGVWAVQITSVYCTPTSPYTFFMEPSGCLQLDGWGEQMGNFLIPLCALPCSLTVTTGDGVTCSGSTSDAPIGISENPEAQIRMSVQGGSIELTSDSPLPRQQMRVIDASGRSQLTMSLVPGQRWNVSAPSAPGVYTLVLGHGDHTIVRRFTIVD